MFVRWIEFDRSMIQILELSTSVMVANWTQCG